MLQSIYKLWGAISTTFADFYSYMSISMSSIVPDWMTTLFNIISFGVWDNIKDMSLLVFIFGSGLITFLAITLVQWVLKAIPLA